MNQPATDDGRNGLILIVGGYGVVGRRIAADLAPGYPDRVLLGGRTPPRASPVI